MNTSTTSRFLGVSVAIFALLSGAKAGVKTLAHAGQVEMHGMSECKYGPSFWCKNITNAVKCKSLDYCIRETWKIQEYHEDDSEMCEICVTLVSEGLYNVLREIPEKTVTEVLDKLCYLLPLDEMTVQCKKVMSSYLLEFGYILESTKPSNYCSIYGYCNDSQIDNISFEKNIAFKRSLNEKYKNTVEQDRIQIRNSNEVSDDLTCKSCKMIINNNGDILTANTTESEFLDELEGFCSIQTDSSLEECSIIAMSYGPSFWNLRNKVPAWMMCEEIALCHQNQSAAVQRLKDSRCLEGMEYWCASADNAKKCQAERLCTNLHTP